MSNQRRDRASADGDQQSTAGAIRTFADFRDETDRGQPYPVTLPDGEVIEIPPPDTVEQVMGLSEWRHNPREVLRILCGVHYERVYESIKHERIGVLNRFLHDLAEHFGMGALPPPGGGS